MKIAFIDVTATVSYGGVQTAVWQLAIALTDLGHQITVFGGVGDLRLDFRGRSISVRTFPFTPREKVVDLGNRFRRYVERRTFASHARSAVGAGGYDWAILTKPFDFFWVKLMPKESTTRFAFMSGGTDFIWGDRRSAVGIHAWMACSHFNAWQIRSRYKSFPSVVYNGVDVCEFHPQRRSPDLRRRWGVDDHEILYAFAGRLVGWKGLNVAIAAMATKEMRDLPAKLLVIGSGESLPSLQAMAQDLDIGDRVLFIPPVAHSELPASYASADVGVFPSIGDEAFGITIAEAMACGLPVVASHIGGIPEVVGNEGSCGLLVAPGVVSEWALAMAHLARNPLRRREIGECAAHRIQTRFTWNLAAQRFLTALTAASK